MVLGDAEAVSLSAHIAGECQCRCVVLFIRVFLEEREEGAEMEFNFNVNEVFRSPIVEIPPSLIPPGFKGDRRQLW